MQNIAKKFGVEEERLLTHLLVYKLDFNDLQKDNINTIAVTNKREHIECLRTFSKEKYKDVMLEWLENLEEIKSFGEEKEKMMEKIAEMESKLLNKMEQIKTANWNESTV